MIWLKRDTTSGADGDGAITVEPALSGSSLLDPGADATAPSGSDGGSSTAGAVTAGTIPEKFLVKDAAGTVDYEATLSKLGGSYTALEKKLGEPPPGTAADYHLEPFMPDGYDLKAEKQTVILEQFHGMGLTNKQANGVLKLLGSSFGEALDADTNLAATSVATLKARWGEKFDTNLAAARKAIGYYVPEDLRDALKDPRVGSNPLVLELMMKVGKELAEDTLPSTWDTAQTEDIEKLRNAEAYRNEKHPDHLRTIRLVNDAYVKGYRAKQ